MKNNLHLILLLISQISLAQVGIGTTNPAPSSALDITSTEKGLLIPRLTTAQRIAITSPTESLMVFDTDVKLYYFFVNGVWSPINVGIVKTISATSYTLSLADSGKILDFTSSSAITLIVPTGLPIGYQISVTQAGTGTITIQAASGVTILNRWNGFTSSGQWAKVGIEIRATNNAIISGDVK